MIAHTWKLDNLSGLYLADWKWLHRIVIAFNILCPVVFYIQWCVALHQTHWGWYFEKLFLPGLGSYFSQKLLQLVILQIFQSSYIYINHGESLSRNRKTTGPRSSTCKNSGKPLLFRSNRKIALGSPSTGILMLKKNRSCKSFGGPVKLGFYMWLSVSQSGKGPKVFRMSDWAIIFYHIIIRLISNTFFKALYVSQKNPQIC